MSETTFKKLRIKAREREFEMKVEATRREQMERERT